MIVANSRTTGRLPFRWGPGIRPDDGQVAVCVIQARTVLDDLSVAWHLLRGQERQSPHIGYVTATRSIRIEADCPLPAQADGEIVGQTPVDIEVIPGAIDVVVPPGFGATRNETESGE